MGGGDQVKDMLDSETVSEELAKAIAGLHERLTSLALSFDERMKVVEQTTSGTHEMITSATALISTTLEDAKPTLDRLMKSPIVRMLGGDK